jgi:hypothetical protein
MDEKEKLIEDIKTLPADAIEYLTRLVGYIKDDVENRTPETS